MRKQWVLREAQEAEVERLSRALDIHPLTAKLLIHRGATSPEQALQFLCPDLSFLPSPKAMLDLPIAVDLIRKAIGKKQRILLVGDDDVDGLTSAALIHRTILRMGGAVEVHIPDRVEEGYGVTIPLIQEAHRRGIRFLITADCGTTHFEPLQLARRLGWESVVVDHHDLKDQKRPPASAFLNPLQPGCLYPEKDLASVGVAFVLACGLVEDTAQGAWDLFQDLDLVALGTVADVAPLKGANRIWVKVGLYALQNTSKLGLKALIHRVGLADTVWTPEDVAYALAPPLNAMGRTGLAAKGFRLLVTEDPQEAEDLAHLACRQNRYRATLEREAFRAALVKVNRQIQFGRDRILVLGDPEWDAGFLGSLAGRLVREFHRPVVAVALNGTLWRGSARSIPGFSLTEALGLVREYLVEFGGHPAAAGFTIAPDRWDGFRQALQRIAFDRMDPACLVPRVELDAELPMAGLSLELIQELEVLGPFGFGNPRPIFACESARLRPASSQMPYHPQWVPIEVEDGSGRTFRAIHPRQWAYDGFRPLALSGTVQIAYSPTIFLAADGSKSVTMVLKDLRLPC